MPKFGTITAENSAVAYLRNIEVDRVVCSYQSRFHAQYYNKIGAVSVSDSGRFRFDAIAITAVKTQTKQSVGFAYAYRKGFLDILSGATFDITEAVSYSQGFIFAEGFSEIIFGSGIAASAFLNASRCEGKKFLFRQSIIYDPVSLRNASGTLNGVYSYGNLINGYTTDLAIGGDTGDLASKRGQNGDAVIVGTVDFNTLVKQGVYSPEAKSTNGPNFTSQQDPCCLPKKCIQ